MILNDEDRSIIARLMPHTQVTHRTFNLGGGIRLPSESPSLFTGVSMSSEERAAVDAIRQNIISKLNNALYIPQSDSDFSNNIISMHLPPMHLQTTGHGLWKETVGSTRFRTLHQQAIQNAMSLTAGSKFLALDIETLGELNLPSGDFPSYFGITEIAARGFRYSGGGAAGVTPLGIANMRLAIKQDDPDTLLRWINDAKERKSLFDYQRRTIESLMKYDPDSGAIIRDGKIVRQATIGTLAELAESGRPFTEQELDAAARGLQELNIRGIDRQTAMKRLGSIISFANSNNMPILTHNGIEFDIPRLQHAFSTSKAVTEGLANAKHLDFLHLLRTQPDIYKSLYGGSRRLPIPGKGELTLEQISEYLRRKGRDIPVGTAHEASFDIEALAKSFAEVMDSGDINLRQRLQKAQMTEWVNDANPLRLHSGLQYNAQEINPLDLFYSVRGRFARGDYAEDMILRRAGDRLERIEFPQMSVRRNQFYQFIGYGTAGQGDALRHFAVFNMLDTLSGEDEYHVISAKTHGALAESIHQALRPWNRDAFGIRLDEGGNAISGHKTITDRLGRTFDVAEEARYITRVSNEDLALRRWRRMFSAEKSGGFALLNQALQFIEDPDQVQGLSNEMRRDFSIMAPRLRSEAPLWRRIIQEIEGQGFQTEFERDLALQIAHEEVTRQLTSNEMVQNPLNIVPRKATILEMYDLPVLDPTTKDLTYISFADRDLAQNAIRRVITQRARSARVKAQSDRTVEAEFNRFVRSLSMPHTIRDGDDIINIPAILTRREARMLSSGNTLDTRIRALIDTVIGEKLHMLNRPDLRVESLSARGYNPLDYVDVDSISSAMRRNLTFVNPYGNLRITQGFWDWIQSYERNIAPTANLVGNTNIVQQLAHLRSSFSRNNMSAIFGYNEDATNPMIRMILHANNDTSAGLATRYMADLSAQQAGRVPSGITQIDIPLPNERGIIRLGGREVLGQSKMVLGSNQILVQTPFEQFTNILATRAESVTRYAASGDTDMAQYIMRKAIDDAVSSMSGVSGILSLDNEIDLIPRGNESDLQRRAMINIRELAPLAIERIRTRHPTAIKTNIDDLKPYEVWGKLTGQEQRDVERALHVIINQELDKRRAGEESLFKGDIHGIDDSFYVQPVGGRATQIGRGMLSIRDPRMLYPFAAQNKLGRENPLQFMNYHSLLGEEGFRGADESVYAGHLMVTREQMAELARHDHGRNISGIYAPGVAIDEKSINRLIEDLGLGEDYDFITRPSTYEQQFVISRSLADEFRTITSKRFIVDEVADGIEVGSTFGMGDALGSVGERTSHFNLKGIGTVQDITQLEDGRWGIDMSVLREMDIGTKIAFGGGEKGTVMAIVDDDKFARTFGEGVKWAAYLDVYKHQDIGSLIGSQVAKGAMAVRKGILTPDDVEAAFMAAYGQEITWDDAARRFIVPHAIERDVTANQFSRFSEELDRAIMLSGQLANAQKLGLTSMHKLPNGMEVLSRLDEIRMANVYEELSASHMFPDDSINNSMRSLGLREWKAIRYKYWEDENQNVYRLNRTMEWLEFEREHTDRNVFQKSRREITALREAIGYQVGGLDAGNVETLRFRNVNLLPAGGKYHRDDLVGTLFDSTRPKVFALELPEEVMVNLRGSSEPGTLINRVFMSRMDLNAMPTGELVLNDLQKAQERVLRSIYEYEQFYSNVPVGGVGVDRSEVIEEMQKSVQSYIDEMAKIGDSGGLISERIIKTQIRSSGFGRTHILSPDSLMTDQLAALRTSQDWIDTLRQENIVIMSRRRALEMGLEDTMDDLVDPTRGVYGLSQRFPNIHPDTIAVTRFFVHDSVQGDQVFITPGMARRLNADSDGDFHAMYFANKKHLKDSGVNYEDLQSELRAYWNAHQGKWAEYRAEAMSKYETMIENQQLNKVFGAGARAWMTAADTVYDLEAKLGKTLIGSVSNLAQGSADYATMLLDRKAISRKQWKDFLEFTLGVEQKSIDVKHFGATGFNPFNIYHMQDPQEAQTLINLIRGSQNMQLEERRQEFMRRFVDTEDALFSGKRDLVENFFDIQGRDPRMWSAVTRDLMYSSSASRQGLGAVWEMLSTGSLTPNRREALLGMGLDSVVESMEASTVMRTGSYDVAPEIMDTLSGVNAVSERTTNAVSRIIRGTDPMDMVKIGGFGLAGLSIAAMAMRAGTRNTEPMPEDIAVDPPQASMGQPTARVMDNTRGYPGYSVKVKASDSQGMDPAQLASVVNNGIQDQMPMQLNTNVFVRDDSSKMSVHWIQDLFNNALNRGYG